MNYFNSYAFFLLILSIIFYSCSSKEKSWEYKVVSYSNSLSLYRPGEFDDISITPSLDELNKLGDEGWQIATSYLEIETAFPNFGNEKYHTGIKSNIRPKRLVIIFKREK